MNANMTEHTLVSELLSPYSAGSLDRDQRLVVEQHLPTCPDCQADLALWRAVAREVLAGDQTLAAPSGLVDLALAQVRRPTMESSALSLHSVSRRLHLALQLLCSQAPLVQREIWPVSALVIGLGFVIALISAKLIVIYALAPLIAAACVSLIYGPGNDPAFELALATPTSPRQILLARLVLVFGYNLTLVLVAGLGLLPLLANQFSQPLLGGLLLAWLAPMTFLSAAALVLSLWIGASNAISVTYLAWLGQLLAGPLRSPQAGLHLSPFVAELLAAYQSFWQTPVLLLALSALLLALALWLAGRGEQAMLTPA